MDELTGAHNSSTTREVSGIIDQINRKGTTVLLVTHDANVAVHADWVIYLEDGRIMDTLSLGKYDASAADQRDAEMKQWLKKDGILTVGFNRQVVCAGGLFSFLS